MEAYTDTFETLIIVYKVGTNVLKQSLGKFIYVMAVLDI